MTVCLCEDFQIKTLRICLLACPMQLYREITMTIPIDFECIISLSAPFVDPLSLSLSLSLWSCIQYYYSFCDLEWRHFVLHIIPCQERLMDWERAKQKVKKSFFLYSSTYVRSTMSTDCHRTIQKCGNLSSCWKMSERPSNRKKKV
jgi:hypothetical protein